MSRKDDHLHWAVESYQPNQSNFKDLQLIHHSFPEMAVNQVDLSTELFDRRLSCPFFINAMTGGSDKAMVINRGLAEMAKALNLMVVSGSYSPALRDKQLRSSYTIFRQVHSRGVIGANLGADKSIDDFKEAIEVMEADFLEIHVNALQELIMPEGERDFRGWIDKIGEAVQQIKQPVVVKEVGVGMSVETVEQLYRLGVRHVDVSGRLGTNFAYIENRRRAEALDYLNDWGQTTLMSLLDIQPYREKMAVIASGGIITPLDCIKCLILGARIVGLSGTMLYLLEQRGVDGAIERLIGWQEELKLIMTLLGKEKVNQLTDCQTVVTGLTKQWFDSRRLED